MYLYMGGYGGGGGGGGRLKGRQGHDIDFDCPVQLTASSGTDVIARVPSGPMLYSSPSGSN